MKEKILIVEDQFIEANNLEMILTRAGYAVSGIARSVPAALKLIEQDKPDMVMLDIFLQGPATGIDLAKVLREKNIAFIYLSANSNKEILDQAKATYPYGFLVKPFREKDVLVTLEVARYLHLHSLESMIRNTVTSPEPETDTDSNFHGIIGHSSSLKKMLEHLQIVAPVDTSVLILGESGTGKEKVAELVHELSARSQQPLVKVNCAALPATLIESVLFGHEKGAYTGATERRIGKFEQANKGTIFLDEIGEMPMDLQMKLLRVLQEREIERIGGNTTIKIDVRVIAATNRNLEQEVAEGRFRMDLYYRLRVFPLTLPPLRERKEDIHLLAYHFLHIYNAKAGRQIKSISPKIMDMFLSYDWPGNIRELEHMMETAVLLSDGKTINQVPMPAAKPAEPPKVKTIEENEREHIISVLIKCNGKIFGKNGAAELLGMNVSTLNSRIKKLGIDKTRY
ncbi:DNA-binding transcriptional response regulator, NtrC family, contains REC, AAA-type ATPase, and a Fis-type DNA-binding domains [Chitinophaga jiangningensis]|uniref:DNA-binding transcriptional response regulator, NtrC family, contains REC, AAA-type ATPase, and a Fis-type DNA-binding domains n=1 Tax=Chitinophaga jiangningensis TaxID=1419482 RepID=A0A1M6Z129_9BACT|nr:sigma-54 dependent transcriptional regulator [Chitinophaga jiangningensis]SHL24090.1 DNA-binding transcriptional response regulator, NtrC family, contains REC, AAA-type ATPase, and a Fis-type DNA-binding domains [Chitinophaga jiangningensis]